MSVSFRQRVLDYVVANGPVSIVQVRSALGRYITASTAQRYIDRQKRLTIRRYYRDGSCLGKGCKNQMDVGKRYCVTNTLGKLYREGKIRRVSTGMYAKL